MELLIILLLVLLNGIFSMSEIALVSSRKSRLEAAAKNGDSSAKAALNLANSPTRFLSTVQIGITLVGLLTGMYSGDNITAHFEQMVSSVALFRPYAHSLAVGAVLVFITYLSLVLGELVPKRIGMANPEGISKVMATPMNLLSKLTAPFIALLGLSSDLIIRLMNIRPSENSVTEEEIKSLIQEGTSGGVFEEIEQEIVHNVFQLGDRRVTSLMTNRQEIVWLDLEDTMEENKAKMFETRHSVYPVCRGTVDDVVGLVYVKDLIATDIEAQLAALQSVLKDPVYLPESNRAYQALEKFKEQRVYFGIIVDEYGGILGVLTMHDIMDALVGDISEDREEAFEIVKRDDGSYLIDAQLPYDDFLNYFSINIPESERKELTGFNTLGGFVLHILENIPRTGEKFKWKQFDFEVMDMDRSRIDKLLVYNHNQKEDSEE
ncbi:hemolysin family protein [Dyadobacter sandarakinus]|uniref:HlyC/CorC family transporter n=1 Tax=Dyadobacter sandarakinus TaxID=2747268 RepID=A0ABX7I0Q6_9BACT|nr:hemolysin family protein [Dyadobacter sandarakinus]QRQ99625.1 HlyC/CorC family transporter [Dyadobacter sandarakinus]